MGDGRQSQRRLQAPWQPEKPAFRGAREFWATHQTSEYFDWSSARRAVLPGLKPSTETISLRLPANLLADLKVLANRLDVPYQSLLKVFLAQRVHEELRCDRTPEELASAVREPEPPYGRAPKGTHRVKSAKREPTRSR